MEAATIVRVEGLDLVAMNPSAWGTAVDRVRQSLQGMVYNWRLISVIKPTSLSPRIRRIEEQLALLPAATYERQRTEAHLLHMHDLQGRKMMQIEHYLIAWCPHKEAKAALLGALRGSCGGATVCSRLPAIFGQDDYTVLPQTLASTDGTHHWKGMLARTWIGQLSPMLFRRILTLNIQAVVVIDVQTYTPESARVKLDVARQRLEAHGYLQKSYDEERRQAMQDWRAASTHVQRGALLHEIQTAVFIHGDTEQQARSHAASVQQEMSATIPLNTMIGQQHEVAKLITLTPIDRISLPVAAYPMITAQVATLLPLYIHRAANLEQHSMLLGIDLARREPLFANLDHLPAKHAFFAGGTGSGKSSFAATIGSRLMEEGYQLIIIDPQAAFLPLAAAYRDVVSYNRISLDKRSGIRINVLDPIIASIDDELLVQVLHVEEILQWMHGEPFNAAQRGVLRTGLTKLYEGLRGMDLMNLQSMPILADLLVLISSTDQTGIRGIVQQWTEPPFADFYNAQSTLDLRLDPATPLIIYDVSDSKIPDSIKQFLMLMISSAIQRVIRVQPRDAIVMIDEAGVLFANPLLASFAERLAKTARRFGTFVWVIDQTTNLLNTKAGEEIFENSFITLLGSMKSDQAPELRGRFPMLTEQHIQWIIGMGMSDKQKRGRAGHYVLIVNDTPYMIYNDLSAWEWQIIPQKSVTDQELRNEFVD